MLIKKPRPDPNRANLTHFLMKAVVPKPDLLMKKLKIAKKRVVTHC